MWRISVVLLIIFVTIMIARAEEPPEPNCIQKVVIVVNDFAWRLKEQSELPRINDYLDDIIPLDDFKLVIKPDLDNPAEGYVGIKFTF